MRRLASAAVAALALLAPAGATAQTPHVVASANGATARSSANEGEIINCGAAGCTSAITAPARPPATWNGELPVSGRTVVEVTFSRPVELLGAQVTNRSFQRVAGASVERVDDQHLRVTLPAGTLPDEGALQLFEHWTGDDDRGHYDVNRTDFVGIESVAVVSGVKQRSRGGGTVADVEARTSGLIDARLTFGKKTLGQKTTNLAAASTLRVSVPLSRAARRLLADRGKLRATLTISVRPPNGDALTLERQVTLRAKPR